MPPLHWFKRNHHNTNHKPKTTDSIIDTDADNSASNHTHNTHTDSPVSSSDQRKTAVGNEVAKAGGGTGVVAMRELWDKAILQKLLPSRRRFPNRGLVRESIAILQDEVQVMTQYAPFIEATPADLNIAAMDRREVVLGNLIGEGQFSQVFEVCGFELKMKLELAAKPLGGGRSAKPASKKNVQAADTAATTEANAETHEDWTREEMYARQALVERQEECHPKVESCKKKRNIRVPSSSPAAGNKLNFGTTNHSENSFFAHRKNSRCSSSSDLNSNNNIASSNNHRFHANSSRSNCTLHHPYVVKHLKRSLIQGNNSNKDETQQAFQFAAADLVVEALYLSRLDHPNILKVRGLSWSGTRAFGNGKFDSYFLLLDRLTETMDDRIERWNGEYGRTPPEHLLQAKTEYGLQLAQALLYLHQRRIIFRDLKPLNTGFREEDDQIQIFDFGLCRELPPVHDPPPHRTMLDVDNTNVYFMTSAGTLRYMAVEILLGKEYNLKADVYSWAMVYYELLAQNAPYSNFSDEDHKKLVCERHYRPSHYFGCVVPASIQSLLAGAWEENIEQRFTMAQVCERLQQILASNVLHPELAALPRLSSPRGGAVANYSGDGLSATNAIPTITRSKSTPAVIVEATNETEHVRRHDNSSSSSSSNSSCLESCSTPPRS